MRFREFVNTSKVKMYEQEQKTFALDGPLDDLDSYSELDDPNLNYSDMNLSSNADSEMIDAVKKVCDLYKGQGHAQVELLPFISKVVEITKKPVNLADLIAINKKSPEVRSIIDSIDDKKIKFKNMSVKNEDPKKAREAAAAKGASTVSSMAKRAMGK